MLKENARQVLDAFTIDSDGTRLHEDAISMLYDKDMSETTLVVSVPDVYGLIQRSFRGSEKQPDATYIRDGFSVGKAREQLNLIGGRKKIPGISFFITFNEKTHELGLHTAPTLLNVTHNYSYSEAGEKLKSGDADIKPFMAACNSLLHYPKPYLERNIHEKHISTIPSAVEYLIQQVSLLTPLLKKEDGHYYPMIYQASGTAQAYSKNRVDHADNKTPRAPITSPLRRLADFVNVISFSAVLHGQKVPFDTEKHFKAFAANGRAKPDQISGILALQSHDEEDIALEGRRLIAGIVARGPQATSVVKKPRDNTQHLARDFASREIDALLHGNKWKLQTSTQEKADRKRYKTELKIISEDGKTVAKGTGVNANRNEATRDAELHCLLYYRLDEMMRTVPSEMTHKSELIGPLTRARNAIGIGMRNEFDQYLLSVNAILAQHELVDIKATLDRDVIAPYQSATKRSLPRLG